MPYSIGLYFDPPTDALVRQFWKQLAAEGLAEYYHLSGNRPHITLSLFEQTDCPKAQEALKILSRTVHSFPVSFQFVGIFPGNISTVFWGLVVTQPLLDLHAKVYDCFCQFSTRPNFNYYTPGHWIPHCGLAMEVKDKGLVARIIDVCQSLPIPHQALVMEVGLISFRPVKHLFSFSLIDV